MHICAAHRVEIETRTGVEVITVEEGDTILQTALDQGIELTHDCKMGVCMTCPARLVWRRMACVNCSLSGTMAAVVMIS